MSGCQPLAEFCCSGPGIPVGPSSEVSGSPPGEDGSICKDGGDRVPNKHRCTQLQQLAYRQPRAECWTERRLSQSVPSRCVSVDKGSVKYYNKQNRKVVLACQHLPFFNSICRPLAGMENFPPETKDTFLPSCVIEEHECRVSHSRSTTEKVSPAGKPRWHVEPPSLWQK